MNGWKQFLIGAALATAPAFAQLAPQAPQPFQTPQVPQVPPMPFVLPDLDGVLAKANAALAQAQEAMLKNQTGLLFFQGRNGKTGRQDADYEGGTRALDDHKYDEAVRRFDAVIDSKSARADGALYWKAYALTRSGRRDDALASLAALQHDYPNSRWLNEAHVLEAEAKQGSGQAVSPAQETNEDLKLLAINSLMNADPERAMPLLEGVLKGSSAPNVKDRALFVLTQNRSPRAQQILTQYAKGAGNPDLQIRAIRYIGMTGTDDARQQLTEIYNGSNDAGIKRQVIQSLMISNGRDALYSLAKNEKNEELKRQLVNGLFASGDAKPLIDLARKETDPAMKRYIVDRLSHMSGKEAMDYMMELLK